MTTQMEAIMAQKLAQALQPVHLDIVNQSHLHAGHAGDDGSGETHFHVMIVSDRFSGKSRIERQRMVFDALSEEIRLQIHALSMKTLTSDEYERM